MIKTLIAIVGPTAIGKTALSIKIAQAYQTAIISADSRQFYREMSIGTAKPTNAELAAAPHYFINSLHIDDPYSAGDFERDALITINKLFGEKDVVVMVGGSGLFVNAVCDGLDDLPKARQGIREKLNQRYQAEGLATLQQQLKQIDPDYFREVDIQNPQRVIRALEVYESTGKPFSFYRKKSQSKRPFRILKIGLNDDRAVLYNRINNRVEDMMQAGLLDEVKQLFPKRHLPPLLTVGYAELFDYLEGKYDLSEAVEKIKQHTRQYAKRQITWFKKDKDTHWFKPQDEVHLFDFLHQNLH